MTILKVKLRRSSPQCLKGFLEAVDRLLVHPRKIVGHGGWRDNCGKVSSIGGDEDVDDNKAFQLDWIEILGFGMDKGVKEVFPTNSLTICVQK